MGGILVCNEEDKKLKNESGIIVVVDNLPGPDEIWYKTTDGNVLSNIRTNYLPTITSNTYSNGKGKIKLTQNLTELPGPSGAFWSNKLLQEINLPYGLINISDNVFSQCSNLISIVIPNSVTSIGNACFIECTSLINVEIPNSVISIGRECFRFCYGLNSAIIGNNVTTIGDSAFEHCRNLTTVNIGNNVTSIDSYTFHGCTNLETITISNSVTSIGDFAFDECTNLTTVNIGNNVTTIGEKAFFNCGKISTLTIPSSVTSIGANAFTLGVGGSTGACVFCYATTPPTLAHPYSLGTPAVVYVPNEYVSVYRSSWGQYNIEAIPTE